MAHLFAVARDWEGLTDKGRAGLRKLVTELVNYPCKMACQPNNGSVDIFVLNLRKNKVTDWLEIQETGAIGVVFEQYPNPDAVAVGRLSDACDLYNEKIGAEFASDSEGEGEGERESDGGSETSGSETTSEESKPE
jgi:hypothetical protein